MKNLPMTRRRFLGEVGLWSGACFLGAGKAYGNNDIFPMKKKDDEIARLPLSHPETFRILQFTDIHFCNGKLPRDQWKDPQSIEDMQRCIDHAQPHLIAMTGDLWHNNPDGNGEEFMRFAIRQFESFSIPWCFTWGNHDQLTDYTVGHRAFTQAKHSLYRGEASDGNYRIEIEDPSGNALWSLFCLNSGADGLGLSTHTWLNTQKSTTPAFAFFHIPVRQYAESWTRHPIAGMRMQRVCPEKEDGKSLEILRRLHVRACFCGHDHVNDYSADAEGIELVYGRATGHGGYGERAMEKGAKLITLNGVSGEYSWTSLFPDGRKWRIPPQNGRNGKA